MWNKKRIRFAVKKHSRQGIISSGLGGAALLRFGAAVAAAYLRSGPCCVPVPDYIMELWDTGRKELTGYFCGLAAG